MSKKADYPPRWQSGERQKEIKDKAGWRCEWCGMVFPKGSNKALKATRKDGQPMILTVHHINSVKRDLRWTNLVALCQRCHIKVQWSWQPSQEIPERWLNEDGEPPKWITKRKLKYTLPSARQLKLF